MAMQIVFVFSSILLILPFISAHSSSDFENIVLHNALHQVLEAQNMNLRIKNMVRNSLEKAALTDCSQLLDNTKSRLNLAMNDANSTIDDKQTWLNMALSNIETCISGFIDLGILDHSLLHLASNVSVLIKNAVIAVNYDEVHLSSNDDNRIPGWASNAYRRLLRDSSADLSADFVVAQDDSGNARTIQEAIDSASKREGSERFVIYVKAGTYDENVQVDESVKDITIVGDGIGKTIITGDKFVTESLTTYKTSTFGVDGDRFIARDITFRNTAGPESGRAVALRSGSDFSAFYRCSFEGYQDTLYAHSGRQFYRECDIYGTVDFIFGDAAAIFQNCNIYARRPAHDKVTVTAQKRMISNGNTGFIIHNSNIKASEDLNGVETFLGRPWGKYSRTVIMESFLDSIIDPAGWLNWDENADVDDIYYAEYNNNGPGSSTENRVKWKGYHFITDPSEASKFTVEKFLSGGSWLSSANLPFTSGLGQQ